MAPINLLARDTEEREKLFIALYKKAFHLVARYISKMGGTFDDARDVFQDALIIYYEKSATGALNISSTEQAYLLGISKYLWLKKFKDNCRYISLDQQDFDFEEETEHSPSELIRFLETTGKKCMELLRSFYYDQLPLADCAGRFGFSGVRSATVQKYKCLEKIRETVKQKALTYEDFLD